MTYASVKNSRALKTIALAACTLLVVAGCAGSPGGDSSNSAAPSSEASKTPSPTPTPTPSYKPASADGPAENVPVPEMPAVAKEHTEAGFEAFVKYYFELVNYTAESRRIDEIQPYTNRNCNTCQNILRTAEHNRTAESWMVGGDWKLDLVYTNMLKDPQGYIWGQIKFGQDALQNYESKRTKGKSFPVSEDLRWQIVLKPTDSGWLVVDLGSNEEQK